MSKEQLKAPKRRQPCDLPGPQSSHSFWHTEPSHLLKGHRSTRHLPQTADVVVVGSGITGAGVAHHLLNSGRQEHEKINVVLLEAREACWGATGRNGGHCQASVINYPNNPDIGRFEVRNFDTIRRLVREKDIDCEFVAQTGVSALYTEHHLEKAKQAFKTLKETAPDLASIIRITTDKEELASFRVPTAIGVVVKESVARLWPYKLVARIFEDLLTSTDLDGTFNLQTLTPATKIESDSTNSTVTIETPRGQIRASKVILATNGYTSHLLPNFADLIVPCRGQMSSLIPFESVSGPNRLQTSLGSVGDDLDDYLIQRPNESGGHLMFGGAGSLGHTLGTTDDSIVDEKTSSYLRRTLPTMLDLPERRKEMHATHMWTGIMGYSKDKRPWVGEVPGVEGVFLAAGYTGHGMPNAWLCGEFVSLLVRGMGEGEARRETGLPREFLVTKERVERELRM